MPRRIEITLTSQRDDGSYTWRAVGAREPKGVVDGAVIGSAGSVGANLKVDAEFDVDGIVIVNVIGGKTERKQPELLQMIAREREGGVTSQLAGKGDRKGRGGPRRERRDGDDAERRPRRDGDRPPRGDGDRGPRTPREPRPPIELPTKPKPKRLKAGRVHVDAVLSELPEAHRPIAIRVIRGGLPEVRSAIDEQNAKLAEAGQPTIDPANLTALAADLLPRLRTAEWRDRAEAAIEGIADIDLRDLRSVLAAANDAARDGETREIATSLRDKLNARIDSDYAEWLSDITVELDANRSIRALRMASRPPKAGVPFPAELATRIVTATSALLTSTTGMERWTLVIESLAVSPVRDKVEAASIPENVGDDLKALITKWSGSVPQIARQFGIEPAAAPAKPPRRPTGPGGARPKKPLPPKPPARSAAAPAAAAVEAAPPATDAASTEPPVAETPAVAVAPASDSASLDAPPAEAPAAESSSDAPAATADAAPAADIVEAAPAVAVAAEVAEGSTESSDAPAGDAPADADATTE